MFLLYEMCSLTKEIQQFYLPKTGSKTYGAKAIFVKLGMNLESPGRWVSENTCWGIVLIVLIEAVIEVVGGVFHSLGSRSLDDKTWA